MVSDQTIYVLVEAGRRAEVGWWEDGCVGGTIRRLKFSTPFEELEQIGAMLLATNRESVDYRYQESELEQVYEHPARKQGAFTPGEIAKALSCYEYQSCEHPGWHESEAHAFCDGLRDWLVRQLPGYEEAPWDWDESNLINRGWAMLGRRWQR